MGTLNNTMQSLSIVLDRDVFWNRPGEWRAVRALTLHHVRRNVWLHLCLLLFLPFVCFIAYTNRFPGVGGITFPWVLFMVVFAVRGRNDGTAKTLLGLSFTRTAVTGSMWVSAVALPGLLFAFVELPAILFWVWGGPAAPRELLTILPDAFAASACCAMFLMLFTALPDPRVAFTQSFLIGTRCIGLFTASYAGVTAIGAIVLYVNHSFVKLERPFGSFDPSWMIAAFALEIVLSLALIFASAFVPIKGLLEEPTTERSNAAVPATRRGAHELRRPPGVTLSSYQFVQESLGRYGTAAGAFLILWLMSLLGFVSASAAGFAVRVEWYFYWLFLVLAVCAVGQVPNWLTALRCLRALPWNPTRLACFILSGPAFVALIVVSSGLFALALSDLSLPIGWMALVLTVPLLGLLLTPRTGALLYVMLFAVGFSLMFGLGSEQSVGPVLLIVAFASLAGSFYRLHRLIHSSILYKARAMDFLMSGPNR